MHTIVAGFLFDTSNLAKTLQDKLDKDGQNNAVVNARVLVQDASGNMIRTPKNKVVVVEGINDYIIVDKEEVLLIFPKAKEQDIKKILQGVKDKFGDNLA